MTANPGCCLLESPRIAPELDLSYRHVNGLVRQFLKPHPFGISRYGAIPMNRQRASHGITHRLSPLPLEAAGWGFAVMSGFLLRNHFRNGQLSYPTRNFALNLLPPTTW